MIQLRVIKIINGYIELYPDNSAGIAVNKKALPPSGRAIGPHPSMRIILPFYTPIHRRSWLPAASVADELFSE